MSYNQDWNKLYTLTIYKFEIVMEVEIISLEVV